MNFFYKNKTGFDWFIFEERKEMEHVRAGVSFIIKEGSRPLHSIELYSSLHGILSWDRKDDRYTVRVWEGEDRAKSLSDLNYHYTGEFLIATESPEAKEKIISDTFTFFKDKILKELLEIQFENPKDIMIAREQFNRYIG